MALYRATVTKTHKDGDVYLEKGMQLEFASITPPWIDNGQVVKDAFKRVYGIDFGHTGLCNPGFIDVVEIRR